MSVQSVANLTDSLEQMTVDDNKKLHITHQKPYSTQYTNLLPNLTHLFIDVAMNSETFDTLARKLRSVEVMDVSLNLVNKFCFSCVAMCSELQDLTIRVTSALKNCTMDTFMTSISCPPLKKLVILNASLNSQFIYALWICKIPIEELSLARCSFNQMPRFHDILKLPNLKALNLDMVDSPLYNQVDGLVFHLGKLRPELKIFPPSVVSDLTDYERVLTAKKIGSNGCYLIRNLTPETLSSNTLVDELKKWRNNDGKDEDSYWEAIGNCHTFNSCELYGASPIKCPDGRMRIALKEPEVNSEFEFWKFVENCNVNVLVMVKHYEHRKYFPLEVDEQVEFIRTITCLEVIPDTENGITHRVLSVGDKIVHHVQIDWEDKKGIEVSKLLTLMNKVTELEELSDAGKTLVHCQAGVGRTGTFFGALIIKQLLSRAPNNVDLFINLEMLVRALRQQRKKMIASSDQLKCLLEFTKAIFDTLRLQ